MCFVFQKMASLDTNKYNVLTPVLDSIERDHIKFSDRIAGRNYKIFRKTISDLLMLMTIVDDKFASMKPQIGYMGSYFEGLKIKEPTEYDINLILTLPLSKSARNKIILDSTSSIAMYTKVLLPEDILGLTVNKLLSAKLVRQWIQGVITKAINHLEKGYESKTIKKIQIDKINQTSSGPANTLILEASYFKEPICIDLVPTLSIPMSNRAENSTVDFSGASKVFKKFNYFLIPKPVNDVHDWRITFPLHERKLLKDKENLKSVFRLIKLLRDTQNMEGLASYYLKNVFLWKLHDSDQLFFVTNSKANLFMHMLKFLRDELASGEIANYWCEDLNLIGKKESITIRNWTTRLTNIINDIDKNGVTNPNSIRKFFVKE